MINNMNIVLLVFIGSILASLAGTSLAFVVMRWLERKQARRANVDYSKLKFPIGRSGVNEAHELRHEEAN